MAENEDSRLEAEAADLVVTIGTLVIFVAFFGPSIGDLFDLQSFLPQTRWRWSIAWIGLGMITVGLGQRAQSLWTIDGGWSPRVIGHAVASLVVALAFIALAAVGLVRILE